MIVTKEETTKRLALPLSDKIDLSLCRIEQWHDRWDGQIYIAFSGGKDSTALMHLVRSVFPEIPAVFIQTGLEYPEINEFIKTCDNITTIKAKKTFRQVIEEYGYPIINKENAQKLHEIRTTNSDKLRNKRLYGDEKGNGKLSKKWHYLIDAPFKISHQCCNQLKKYPAYAYERRSGRKPMLGTMIEESPLRWTTYRKYGCNMYDSKRPISHPIAFWREEDIWEYIKTFSLSYSKIYDMGYDRTGCMFCAFGVHRDTTPNRFQKMKITHPKLYDYCINNLGMRKVLDFIDVEY